MTQTLEPPVEEKPEEDSEPLNAEVELTTEELEEIYLQAKKIIESLLFCSSEPVTARRLCNALKPLHSFSSATIKQLVEELAQQYESQDRAYRLEEIAKGYILRTKEEFSPYIHALLKTSRPEKLSHAATEVLAIIAYRQPVTRPQIDEIRGVDSSGIVNNLIERQLVEEVGKLEVPGRPTLFGVTPYFLKYFGLKDIKELPSLKSEVRNI